VPTDFYGVFSEGRHFARDVESLAAAFPAATPFPHVVLNGLFDERFLAAVVAELPHPRRGEGFIQADLAQFQELKFAYRDEPRLGPLSRHLLATLHSKTFLEFLSKLTGIQGLIPDPYLVGGGFHQILPGGRLEIHADFNVHGPLRLDRRLNLLLFLNQDWEDAYGGELELWDPDMTRCVRSIPPRLNTTVIFATTDTAYHGHPRPVRCPESMTRKSLALYYYSNGRPEEERSAAHSTLWQKRPE
jgi:Rps23 Pro-64 3,4-dihydroxylase Tpa1-like proline 4-hydroxylase